MKINDKKIMEILNNYDETMRTAGAFILEIDDNVLYITDSGEGIDMVPLNKDLCFKLSELFKELGETL